MVGGERSESESQSDRDGWEGGEREREPEQ